MLYTFKISREIKFLMSIKISIRESKRKKKLRHYHNKNQMESNT